MTEKEIQALIDRAITKHNKNATIISSIIGSILLFFYAHGVVAIVESMK